MRAERVSFTSRTNATVQGPLTAAGRTQPLGSDATLRLAPDGNQATVEAAVVIDRSAFGMTWNPMHMAKPRVKVPAHLVFRRGR